MANNYTTIPAIIPGNLTIAGTLSVQGDEIKVGTGVPYVRILRYPAANGAFTVNLQSDLVTRDDPTSFGYGYVFNVTNPRLSERFVNLAGTVHLTARRIVFVTSSTVQTGIGSGGNLSFCVHPVAANLIDKNGILIFRVWGVGTTVAGGGINMQGTFGGTNWSVALIPASVTTAFDVSFILCNRNAANSQTLQTIAIGNNISTPTAVIAAAINTAADQPLVGVAGLINAADTVSIYGYEGAILNSWGAV